MIEDKLFIKKDTLLWYAVFKEAGSNSKIDLNGKSILVTGSPGFIGANLVVRLLKEL